MTTTVGPQTEWNAASLRPTARWVQVTGADGRSRLEMSWSTPAVEVSQVAPAA